MLKRLREPHVTLSTFLLALVALGVMNVFDAGLSLHWLSRRMMHEGNPFMASIVNNQSLFILVKLTLVSLGSWFLWLRREDHFARNMLSIPCVLYSFVCGGHLGIALMWLMGYTCVAS